MRRVGATPLRRLGRVTGAAEDGALARVREARSMREHTLRALHELDASLAGVAEKETDPAFLVAGAGAWARWREVQRAGLNRELAERTARLETATRRAAEAVGRNEVVRDIADQQKAAERRRARRGQG